MSRGPDRGFYRLVVSVDAPDTRLVGHTAAQLTFKVLTAIDIQGVEIGTADSDQSTAPNLKKFVLLCFFFEKFSIIYLVQYDCFQHLYNLYATNKLGIARTREPVFFPSKEKQWIKKMSEIWPYC